MRPAWMTELCAPIWTSEQAALRWMRRMGTSPRAAYAALARFDKLGVRGYARPGHPGVARPAAGAGVQAHHRGSRLLSPSTATAANPGLVLDYNRISFRLKSGTDTNCSRRSSVLIRVNPVRSWAQRVLAMRLSG